jgi:hypothetical protein
MSNIKYLPDGWEEIVGREYKEGASDVEVRAKLHMTESLWLSLYNDPESSAFREVVDVGRMLAKGWWLEVGRKALRDRAFNAALWHMNMKNRYGWSDKTEIHTKDAHELSSDELDEAVTKAIARAKTLRLSK